MSHASASAADVKFYSAQGRGLLAAAVLGSGIAFLDSTAVNVALPALQQSFGAGLNELQWTVDAYLLFLSALLLVGGALGDHLGRRRVFELGVIGFALTSMACGLATRVEWLILARGAQGIAAALLVPGSLALMRASYREEDQGTAIGAWSGLSGVTSALGPSLGGWLVEAVSWRAIFFLNLPLALLCLVFSRRCVPESRNPEGAERLDWAGAAWVTVGLGCVTYALIEGPLRGFTQPLVWLSGVLGAGALVGFVLFERKKPDAMVPMSLFRSRVFSGANLVTLAVYAALGGALFVITLHLQTTVGYSPLEAGLSLTPITVLLLLLSPGAAKLAERRGARWPMVLGCLCTAGGLYWLSRAQPGQGYWQGLLPGVMLFGLGLSALVSPLTLTVLASVSRGQSGLASGVNNAVARIAGLLAIASLPAIAQLTTDDAAVAWEGYARALRVCAWLCAAGAFISAVTVPARPPPSS